MQAKSVKLLEDIYDAKFRGGELFKQLKDLINPVASRNKMAAEDKKSPSYRKPIKINRTHY